MFSSQVVATIIAGTVQLGVQAWMFANIEDMCSPTQKDGFVCPTTEVFGTASIVWGVIGPQRQFSAGQLYHGLTYFFLIGAVCPLAAYFAGLRWPHSSFLRYINFPVIFNGTSWIPPASAVNYVPWTIVGFIFNFLIRRRHFSWWTKYNCTSPCLSNSGSILTQELHRYSLRGTGRGRRDLDHLHLLLLAVPPERHHRPHHHPVLVGQHRYDQHRRLR